jgi:hypothetical protein
MGSLQLGLPRVVQIWASQLAELDPVPAEKLDVLLRVCGGGSANEGKSCFRAAAAVGLVDWNMQHIPTVQLHMQLSQAMMEWLYRATPACMVLTSIIMHTLCLQEMRCRGHCLCPASCTSRGARCV